MLRAKCRRVGLGSLTVATTLMFTIAAPARAVEIVSPGPLTLVGTSPDLNCYVNHAADAVPEFYGTTACGTLVAAGGTLYGPANIPAGSSASPRTSWTPVSQSAVSGSGTGLDPYRSTTVVTGGPLQVSQVDSYVVGQESYRTDATVTNTGTDALEIVLYRAGDCYLQNSDYGYGRIDAGAPSCLARGPDGRPGSRIEQFAPITADSHYYHATYSQVWQYIGTQRAFPDTCRCDEYIDNGAGVSWTRTLAPGASITLSGFITFSPLGRVPIAITKTPDRAEVPPGGVAGYTITITNPNSVEVPLAALTDDQPPGFTYLHGSSSGMTDADPTVAGSRLTWGPFTLAPNGTSTLHYSVRVSDTPGTYVNIAGGTAEGYTVIPAESVPPVEVPNDPDSSIEADLVVEKSADDDNILAGSRSGYTVTLNNPTTSALRVARVTETLADGVRYLRGSTTLLTTDDPEIDGQRLTWRVDAAVPALSSVKLHFGVLLPLTAADELRNVRVTASGPNNLSVLPASESAPVHLLAQPIIGALQLTKRPNRTAIRAGENVRFTLTVRDLAPKTATVTTICDRVPRGLRIVGGSRGRRVGGRVCWVRAMPAGRTTVRVFYVARAAARTRGRVSSTAGATAIRRDPARASAAVRVLAPRAPAVTG